MGKDALYWPPFFASFVLPVFFCLGGAAAVVVGGVEISRPAIFAEQRPAETFVRLPGIRKVRGRVLAERIARGMKPRDW